MGVGFKIVIFLGFLIIYTAWLIGNLKILQKFITASLYGNALMLTEMMLLLNIFGLLAFVWVLTGFFNFLLTAAILVGTHLSLIVTAVLWLLLGSPTDTWKAQSFFAGAEFAVTKKPLTNLFAIFSTLIVVGYPVAAGFIFFRYSFHSERMTVLVFMATLLMLVLSSVSLLPQSTWILGSKNISEETRARIMVAQLGGLISNALFLSMIFWSFGISGRYHLKIGASSAASSPLIVVVLVVYFVLTVLLPYLAGSQRAKHWRATLLEKRRYWLEEILEALEFPNPAQHVPRLQHVRAQIAAEREHFAESDAMVKAGLEFDQTDTIADPAVSVIFDVYKRVRATDPRMDYMDDLANFLEETDGIIDQLAGLDQEQRIDRSGELAGVYRARKEDFKESIGSEKGGKPLLWVGIVFLLSPILSQVLSEFGKWIWTLLMGSAGS
jgi:hypothetical protein